MQRRAPRFLRTIPRHLAGNANTKDEHCQPGVVEERTLVRLCDHRCSWVSFKPAVHTHGPIRHQSLVHSVCVCVLNHSAQRLASAQALSLFLLPYLYPSVPRCGTPIGVVAGDLPLIGAIARAEASTHKHISSSRTTPPTPHQCMSLFML